MQIFKFNIRPIKDEFLALQRLAVVLAGCPAHPKKILSQRKDLQK